jgi:ATP-binding cassette subfamily D (ALD) long-chain fatty acid import protein
VQQGFDGVRFERTPIVVPGNGRDLSRGELLIEDLDILITPGQHLLISGSNGVGKTSIARVLAGLWPVFRGLVSKPLPKDISFLPQRPYLSNGTLREQIIYPHSHAEMIERGRTDSELMEILKLVKLEYIPSREGGWETKKQWKDVFSGGEKQRVMFARILYQSPKFAVIDEGTSAVSQDVEGLLYEACKRRGVTLITISHRPSLLKYHTAQLKVGLGDEGTEWQLEYNGSKEAKLSVAKEIEEIRAKLAQVPEWEARRDEITQLLSGKA